MSDLLDRLREWERHTKKAVKRGDELVHFDAKIFLEVIVAAVERLQPAQTPVVPQGERDETLRAELEQAIVLCDRAELVLCSVPADAQIIVNAIWPIVQRLRAASPPPETPPAQTPDRPMEWQPMETAPEDTPILMKMKHGVIQGTWDKKAGTGSGYYWTDITWFPQAWMPVPPFTRAQEGKA